MNFSTVRELSLMAFGVVVAIVFALLAWGTFFAKKKPPGDMEGPDEEL